MTKNSRQNETNQNLFLFIIVLFLAIILCSGLLLLLYYPEVSAKYLKTQDSSAIISSTEEKIVFEDTEKELYNVLPGYTYFEGKNNLKLYADIFPMVDDRLIVIGSQFHNENFKETLMEDASIKELFYRQEDGSYKNKDNTITILLVDNTASFKDNRTTVSIPFSGELELIPEEEIIEEINEEVMEDDNIFKDGTLIETTKVDNILVDTYDSSPTPDNYISKDFQKYLTPDNERQEFTFTAKYIETDTNSGVKYQEINSGIYFYTFGSGFPYDSNLCNTITITATYRGYNKKFNGLSMQDSFPCFVTKSIRKPNKQEITTP